MKKTLFVTLTVLMILNACAAPPPPTEAVIPSTQTPIPTQTPTKIPTPTPLPPTPALDGLFLSDETLSTKDGVPLYILNNSSWDAIPPENLSDELATLTGWDYHRGAQNALQIVDINGNILWTKTGEFWIELPANLPDGWQFLDEENIADRDGVTQYKLDTKTMKWLSVTKESLEAAQEYASSIVKIVTNYDTAYGYNEAGGVIATFNPETGEWGPNPFTDAELENLIKTQYNNILNATSQEFKIERTISYGSYGDGAKQIMDTDNNPTGYYVLYSAIVWGHGKDGESRVFEIPIIKANGNTDPKEIVLANEGIGVLVPLEDSLMVIAERYYSSHGQEEIYHDPATNEQGAFQMS